jgi:hypothetical protein
VVTGAPRRWLGLEGFVLLGGALIAFGALGQPWWLVPAAILAPDIAMTGYLAGTRPGAHLYNLTHATPLPAVMLGAGYWHAGRLVMALALIWLAGSVQLSRDGKIIRVHPIRHDRARELGAFANPKGRPRRNNSSTGNVV